MKNTKVFPAVLVMLVGLMITVETKAQSTIVSLVGDKDGFGIGVVCGDSYTDIRAFTADATDPLGTDVLLFTDAYIGPRPHPFGGLIRVYDQDG